MNLFSRFLLFFFIFLAVFLICIIPGILIIWIWAALRTLGVGAFWIIMMILIIDVLITIPFVSLWNEISRYLRGMC